MKRNYFNGSDEIKQYAYIGSTDDSILLEQNEPFLNEGHDSYTPEFYAHDIHFRNATHSDDPYVKFKCFKYNSRNPWEQSYSVNFYNGTTKLNLVKRGTAFVDIVPRKYLNTGNYYVYWNSAINLGSVPPANDKYTYQCYDIYNSTTKSTSTRIGGFYAESDRVCIIMQAGGGGGGAPTSGTDGAAGGGGGCAVFMLNLGLIRGSTSACIYFSIGTGGSRSGGGWGSKGSNGNTSSCYFYPSGPTGGISSILIAWALGGNGGGNNTAGTGEYGYLDTAAVSNGYCWKMPGISYGTSGNSYRHCKGGNGGTMAHAGGATNYTAYLQCLPSSGYSSYSYSCAGTGGTSAGNAGGGGGAGAYPESKGGNGGAASWATGDAGTLGGGGGGARYQWGDGGKGGNGGNGALIISEACVPPICDYDLDTTSDINVYNYNSIQATIWVNGTSSKNVASNDNEWVTVSGFERYYNIRLVLSGLFTSQSINAYSGTSGDD